jgi:peptidoglycan/LPS O-acetylase OafA/YrhL
MEPGREWFYLLFPVILFTVIYLFKKLPVKSIFLFITILMITISVASRMIISLHIHSPGEYDLLIRRIVITRFDSIGVGLLMAYLFNYRQQIFLFSKPLLFFIPGCIGMFLLNFLMVYQDHFIFEVLFLLFESFFIFLLFPLLLTIKKEKIPFRPIRFLSLISYLLYLTHLLVFKLLTYFYKDLASNGPVFVMLFLWALLIISSLLYYGYEKPIIMSLREKLSSWLLKQRKPA